MNSMKVALTLIGILCMHSNIFSANEPPTTKKSEVKDFYHNTEVTDTYRWLEDYSDTEVVKWSDDQNKYTRDYLDNLEDRQAIKKRLEKLYEESSNDYYSLKYVNGLYFAMKTQPPLNHPLLVVFESLNDLSSERVLIDLNTIDPEQVTAIDFFEPSSDASLIAVSMSRFGSELGDVFVFDVKTGNQLSDHVRHVNGPTAGGDVAWVNDNSGFYYTRYPHENERPEEDLRFFQQVYFHKLGTDNSEDVYQVGEQFPRIAEIELDISKDSRFVLATVADGDGGEFQHYLQDRTNGEEWKQITDNQNLIPKVIITSDNHLLMLSNYNSPNGKIIKATCENPKIDENNIVVKESEYAIKEIKQSDNYLYVSYVAGGPNVLYLFDLQQNISKKVELPEFISIYGMTTLDNDRLLYKLSSYTDPSAWYIYDPENDKNEETAIFNTSPADFSDIKVVRKFAVSKDGTKVPINILMPDNIELNGNNPTILYGYGGYGINLSPSFDSGLRLWFDQGGIYCIANLRGGGEFGEEWHLAGNLTNKQNVFDDFEACARYLVDNKYTSSNLLTIRGGSNGGLLMGAAMTQNPELYRTVVSAVGIYDMLRVELDPNGEFNITEFGTVNNPEQFKALYAYSPYHNVKMNTPYPSVLFITGEHDGRVNPYQSRKMTALLQEATSSGNPIFLRTNKKAGHGRGTTLDEKIEMNTDIYSFILSQIGRKFKYDI